MTEATLKGDEFEFTVSNRPRHRADDLGGGPMRKVIPIALAGSIGCLVGSGDAWWAVALFLGTAVVAVLDGVRRPHRATQPPFRPERCNVVPVRTFDWQRHADNISPTSVHGPILGQGISGPQAARKTAGRGGAS